MSEQKICFVISPIGSEESDTRERADTVFGDVIEEVVGDFGYTSMRADHISEPGIITNQVIEHVVESELVIADLTGKNPNVFYELAVRHAHQKPVIQLINKDEDIPFDVATQRTINIDLGDFATTNRAQEQITEQIQEIEENDFQVENPVSVAGKIRELRQSEEPEKQTLAEFTETLNEINSKMRSIEQELENPEQLIPPEYIREIQNQLSTELDSKSLYRIHEASREVKILIDSLEEPDMSRDEIKNELTKVHHLLNESLLNIKESHHTTLDNY